MESCSFWARKKSLKCAKAFIAKWMDFAIWRKISFPEVWLVLESWEVFVDFSFEWFSVSETMFASIQNLVHFKVYKVLNSTCHKSTFQTCATLKMLFSSWCPIVTCLFTIQQLPKQEFCRCDCNCIPYFSIFSPMEKF